MEDFLLRELNEYIAGSCRHRNYAKLSLKKGRESARPCDAQDGLYVVVKAKQLLETPSQREFSILLYN